MVNMGADPADTMANMVLQATEIAGKLSLATTKEISIMLYSILRNYEKSSGKTALRKLIKSGEPLRVIGLTNDELKIFQKEAKSNKIVYAPMRDRNNVDDKKQVVIKASTNEAMVYTIIERNHFACVKENPEISAIAEEILNKTSQDYKDKMSNSVAKGEVMSDEQADALVDQLFLGNVENAANPQKVQTEKNQSKSTLKIAGDLHIEERPSVRKAIKQAKQEVKTNKIKLKKVEKER